MELEVIPAYEVTAADLARLLNAAFAGYLGGWSEMDAASCARGIHMQGADLYYSRLLRHRERLVALGYINRTGNISRIAGMGTVPEVRRTGAANQLLLLLLEEAKARRDEAVMLEVFEQNEPAVALYRKHGFRELCRLIAWRRYPDARADQSRCIELQEVSLNTASRVVTSEDYPELPWQISRRAMLNLPLGRAYRAGDAFVVIADAKTSPVQIRGLFSNTADDKRWSSFRDAVAALIARFPKQEFLAPAIFPDRFGREVFEPLGFVREPLNQFLMRRDL